MSAQSPSTRSQAALDAIAVKVELASGNIPVLLHEIRHALARLLHEGASTCIDVKRIPLAPGEEERLVEWLGKGEVRAQLAALGSSEVTETAFTGVWLVSHCDDAGALQARFIEVTHVPDILRAQHSDMTDSLARLTARLATQ